MPNRDNIEGGYRQRNFKDLQTVLPGQEEFLWPRGNQVGAQQRCGQRKKVGQAQPDPPGLTKGAQGIVDGTARLAAAGNNQSVWIGAEGADRDVSRQQWMVTPHSADVSIRVDRAGAQVGRGKLWNCDGEVEIASFEPGRHVRQLQRPDHKPNARRLGLEMFQQGHDDGDHHVIGGGDSDFALRCSRIECRGSQQLIGTSQKPLGWLDKRFGSIGGDQTALSACKERIPEHMSKPREGITYRGLRQRETFGCARDAALIQECVEHYQQIQVRSLHIHQHYSRSQIT
jgi:hypothetical protein